MNKIFRNIGIAGLFTSLISIWLLLTTVKKIGAPDASIKIIHWITKYENILLILMLFVALLSVVFLISSSQKIRELLFKYRYILALVVLFIAVLFKINGSSMGILGIFLNNTDKDHILLGVSRTLRSDEWSVSLPFQLSQSFNHYAYYSSLIRGGGTDTFILSGLASWDFATLFRPANLGFLFLGFERGLSFLWTFKILFLFMSVFEMGRVVTNDNRKLSLFLSFMITFSAVVQWWYGMIEMIAAGSIFIVLFDKYLKENRPFLKLIYTVIMSWAGSVYILTFYPAWQVPLAYIFFVLLVYIIIENYKTFNFNYKLDLSLLTLMTVLIITSSYIVLSKAWPTVQTTMNTVYPGNRVSFGGGAFKWIFDYVYQIFYPITDIIDERAMDSVYDLFPVTQVLAILAIIKTKDKLLSMLMMIDALFLLYISFSIPKIFARITLLSFTTPARLLSVFGILNLIILVRFLTISTKRCLSRIGSFITAILLSVGIVFISKGEIREYLLTTIGGVDQQTYFRLFTLVAIFVLFAILYFVFRRNLNGILVMGISISFLAGVLANPVRVGSDVVTKSPLVERIKSINSSDPGLWIVEGGLPALPYNNVPLLGGASVLNSTNAYPNIKLWKKIDKENDDSKVYNRYAHISFNLIDENSEAKFKLNSPDSYTVSLPITELKTLKIKYIMTDRNLEDLSNGMINFEQIADVNGIKIYTVKY